MLKSQTKIRFRLTGVLVLSGLLFYHCSSPKKELTGKKALVFNENITFKTGFSSGNTQIETLNGEEFICFGDYKTYKKIVLHSLESEEQHTVDLSQITNLGEKIIGYEIQSLDTIMVLCYSSNNLYFLNRDGAIWKHLDLNPYVDYYGPFELMRSSTPFQLNDTSLLFTLNYANPAFEFENSKEFAEYVNLSNKQPKLFRVDNIYSDSLKTKVGAYGLYASFTPENYVASEGYKFQFGAEGITFISSYSDTIYTLDQESLSIIKKSHVKSAYSDLMIKPIRADDFLSSSELVNSNFRSNGQLRRLVWDAKNELYYCFTSHKPSSEFFPLSILLLDRDLKPMNEVKLDEKKYQPAGQITSKGLFISNYNETFEDDDFNKKNTFALFNYE